MVALPKIEDRDYYTVEEAADLLGVEPVVVRRILYANKLPVQHRGRLRLGIGKAVLDPILESAASPDAPIHALLREAEQRILVDPPSEEELERRRELIDQILENRKHRNISPLTTADLVHRGREWNADPDAPSRW